VLTDEERKNSQKIRSRRWYERNRDKAIKNAAAWKKANPEGKAQTKRVLLTDEERKERRRTRMRRWQETSREHLNLYHRDYNHKHPDKGTAKRKRYYETNREKILKQERAWQETNPERFAEMQAAWYRRNIERLLPVRAEASRAWHKANPEKCCAMAAKRRALKYSNTPISEMLTSTEWLAILAEANGHCAYCGKETKLTLDHVIPLSKGGKHSKDNVAPVCGHCNSSKGNKNLEEWNAKRLRQAKN
jgi:5-methylcytosine-specific restriction endonuclease McrA